MATLALRVGPEGLSVGCNELGFTERGARARGRGGLRPAQGPGGGGGGGRAALACARLIRARCVGTGLQGRACRGGARDPECVPPSLRLMISLKWNENSWKWK